MEKVKKKTRGDISFESALKELETIANRLEDGSLSLDKSIEEFEHGVKLARFCHNKLQEAERRIEILQKGDTAEPLKKKALKIQNESGDIEEDDDLQGTLL